MSETPISSPGEREFWGVHEFREVPDSMCCSRCGWGYHDPIHGNHEFNLREAVAKKLFGHMNPGQPWSRAELVRMEEYRDRADEILDALGARTEPGEVREAVARIVAGLTMPHVAWEELNGPLRAVYCQGADGIIKSLKPGHQEPTSNHLREVVAKALSEARRDHGAGAVDKFADAVLAALDEHNMAQSDVGELQREVLRLRDELAATVKNLDHADENTARADATIEGVRAVLDSADLSDRESGIYMDIRDALNAHNSEQHKTLENKIRQLVADKRERAAGAMGSAWSNSVNHFCDELEKLLGKSEEESADG